MIIFIFYNLKKVFLDFINTAFIYSISAVITVKVNDYMKDRLEECIKDKNEDFICRMLSNETSKNAGLFFTTFLSTLILCLILYYVFGYYYGI